MPRYGMNAAGTRHEYGGDMDFHIKSEVSGTIQHDTLPILKYPCIINDESETQKEATSSLEDGLPLDR